MIIIVCVDDANGMMFNKRRQSRDRLVTEDILKVSEGKPVWMNSYSGKLFEHVENKKVDDDFLKMAEKGDICFVEDQSLKPFEDKIEKIILYKWNRAYPGDVHFDISLGDSGWKLEEIFEFPGYSHEKITRETYVKTSPAF